MDPDDGDEIGEGPEVIIGDADPIDEEEWEVSVFDWSVLLYVC
jgi:hypothetical protein